MSSNIRPLRAEKFLKAALEYMEPFRGTYIYDAIIRDFIQKTGQADAGYGQWLKQMLEFVTQKYNLRKRSKILDFGCGTGELTVQMRCLGYEAYGLDMHQKHLELAKILAKENGLPEDIFVLNKSKYLPFDNNSFDIITMFSVLEHLNNNTLKWLLPELKRICSGVVYVLAPNRLKITDDHTGLHFVPFLPHWLAALYVKSRGRKYRYFISESGTWDVYYRSYSCIVSLFKKYGFKVIFPPYEVIFPPLEQQCPLISEIDGNLRLGTKRLFIKIPLPYRMIMKLGYPKQAFYPYLNLIFIPERRSH